MMEFQKSTKKGLVLENVAPETIIVEKSNLIDNTRISTNFIINEEQESLISKEENKSNRNNEDNDLGFNLNRINSTINNNHNKDINNINNNNNVNNNKNNEIYKNNSKENNNNN